MSRAADQAKFEPGLVQVALLGGAAGASSAPGPLSVEEIRVETDASAILDAFKPRITLE